MLLMGPVVRWDPCRKRGHTLRAGSLAETKLPDSCLCTASTRKGERDARQSDSDACLSKDSGLISAFRFLKSVYKDRAVLAEHIDTCHAKAPCWLSLGGLSQEQISGMSAPGRAALGASFLCASREQGHLVCVKVSSGVCPGPLSPRQRAAPSITWAHSRSFRGQLECFWARVC